MKLRKGDSVIIVAGKDKGKIGVITHAYPKKDLVLIESVNVKKKHQKARRSGSKGQMIEKSMPMHVSNVAIVDPKKGGATRIKISRENGIRERVAKKSGTLIGK